MYTQIYFVIPKVFKLMSLTTNTLLYTVIEIFRAIKILRANNSIDDIART